MGEAAHLQVSQVGPGSIYTREIWRDGMFGWEDRTFNTRLQWWNSRKCWVQILAPPPTKQHQCSGTNPGFLSCYQDIMTTFLPGFLIRWDDIWINTLYTTSDSCSGVPDSLRPHGLYSPGNSPGQNTGVGSHFLLQGIFPIQGSNPGLTHCRQILYQLSHHGSPIHH